MERNKRKYFSALAALSFCVSLDTAAFADNWINPAGGSWGDPSNWSDDVVPANAVFNLNSTGYTVTLPGMETPSSIAVQTDNPTLNLSGQFMTASTLQIADASGQNGSMTIIGTGMLESAAGGLAISVGMGGTGQLIVNGATINDVGSGSIVTEGSGGTITVENGGTLKQDASGGMNLGGNLVLNDATFMSGPVTISSANITNGSTFTVVGGVALTINGPVTLDDSTFNPSQGMTIGTGSLTISGGSTVQANAAANLDGPLTVLFGDIDALGLTTYASTVTIQLSPSISNGLAGPKAVFGGTLDITLPNGFNPSLGEVFHLFNYGSTSGTFSAVNLPPLLVGSWNTSSLYTSGTISVVPEPASMGLIVLAGFGLTRRRKN